MPLHAGFSTPHTVYTGKSGGSGNKNPTAIVIGVGIALIAIVALSLVMRGGGGNEPDVVDNDTLAAPVNDGWRNFTPPDGSFTISLPGVPVHREDLTDLNQPSQIYAITQGDFEFGVYVSPVPEYTPKHEAARRLAEWIRPIYEVEGDVIEADALLLTPKGDQAYDLVVVSGGERWWMRFTTWNGSIICTYATLPADQEPTAAQSRTYSRLRDSVHQ